MKPMITRAWSGIIAVLDSPSTNGTAMLAPPDGQQWWKVPMPLRTAIGTGCGHTDIHHVGQVQHVERRGNLLHGRGWICTLHPGFLIVPPELFCAPELVPGQTMAAGEWRMASVYLHPTQAIWPEAKIRHEPHPNGPVRHLCDKSRHIGEDGRDIELGEWEPRSVWE